MKKFTLPENLTQQWYFFPAVGLIIFVFVNIGIFVFLWATNKPAAQGEIAGASTETSPTPKTQQSTPPPPPTQTPETSPTPKTSATPKASATPKTTSTPTPSPSPTATPIDKEDVRINKPSHQTNYDGTSIEIEMDVLSNGEVEKLEVIIDGEVKHTFTSKPYSTTQSVSAGSHRLQGKATLKSGETITSGTLEFGAGGISWDAPAPTPTPSPSATPSPSPES